MTEDDGKSMVNEERVKIFVDELSKSCPWNSQRASTDWR